MSAVVPAPSTCISISDDPVVSSKLHPVSVNCDPLFCIMSYTVSLNAVALIVTDALSVILNPVLQFPTAPPSMTRVVAAPVALTPVFAGESVPENLPKKEDPTDSTRVSLTFKPIPLATNTHELKV